jgi:uncharacterized protein YbjT (DUF2867 family)
MANALVAGATGMLGSRIAHQLLNEPAVAEGGRLGILIRRDAAADPAKKRTIDELVAKGAEPVYGDLHDEKALAEATSGRDVVISAVQGGNDVIVDGQVNLARAAERNAVRRFVPSDFAIDLFHAPPAAPMFAGRREADRIIDGLGLEVLHVLTGGFLDLMLAPGNRGIVNADSRTVAWWGTGSEPFDMTTVEDTARLTARIALDENATAGVHMFSGAQASPVEIAAELTRVTGREFTVASQGSLDELRAAIERTTDPGAAIGLWYQLALATTPPFASVENGAYPDIELTSLRDQVRQSFG